MSQKSEFDQHFFNPSVICGLKLVHLQVFVFYSKHFLEAFSVILNRRISGYLNCPQDICSSLVMEGSSMPPIKSNMLKCWLSHLGL